MRPRSSWSVRSRTPDSIVARATRALDRDRDQRWFRLALARHDAADHGGGGSCGDDDLDQHDVDGTRWIALGTVGRRSSHIVRTVHPALLGIVEQPFRLAASAWQTGADE